MNSLTTCACGSTFESKIIGGRAKVYCSRKCKDSSPAKRTRDSQRYLKITHGLSIEERDNLRHEQDNRCAICNRHEDEVGTLRVDHDHSTGKKRAMLCHHCNVALGHFEDSIDRLTSAIQYLEKYAP